MSENEVSSAQDNLKKRKKALLKFSQGDQNIGITANIGNRPAAGVSDQDHLNQIFQETASTSDVEIAKAIFLSGVNALPHNSDPGFNHNIAIQTLADFAPKDAMEARLCMQSMTVYSRGMNYLAMAENSINGMKNAAGLFEKAGLVESHKEQIRIAISLLKLHNETVDALTRLRRGGEQRFVVQHQYVNVCDGGKAVVGHFQSGNTKSDEGVVINDKKDPHG